MTPMQTRLGRTALGWGVRELAAESGVTSQTVSRLEAGEELRQSTLDKIRAAIERHGIKLIEADRHGGEGVRFGKVVKRVRKPQKRR